MERESHSFLSEEEDFTRLPYQSMAISILGVTIAWVNLVSPMKVHLPEVMTVDIFILLHAACMMFLTTSKW